jgi:hypothetical protein
MNGITRFSMVIMLLACGVKPDRSTASEANSKLWPSGSSCNFGSRSTEELTFSDVTEDSITGDQSGIEFRLTEREGEVVGSVREAAGEFGKPTPLENVTLKQGARLSFILVTNTDTARFVGHISCDSIWGSWSPYPSVVDDHKVFKRSATMK